MSFDPDQMREIKDRIDSIEEKIASVLELTLMIAKKLEVVERQ
jgi:tetrahydromethanopterin S-methyltransferase subunit G